VFQNSTGPEMESDQRTFNAEPNKHTIVAIVLVGRAFDRIARNIEVAQGFDCVWRGLPYGRSNRFESGAHFFWTSGDVLCHSTGFNRP